MLRTLLPALPKQWIALRVMMAARSPGAPPTKSTRRAAPQGRGRTDRDIHVRLSRWLRNAPPPLVHRRQIFRTADSVMKHAEFFHPGLGRDGGPSREENPLLAFDALIPTPFA
jgi:hypothetical protein